MRVTWTGGIRLRNGQEISNNDKDLYRITAKVTNGVTKVITPSSIADLNDGDNNHLLCLDTDMKPLNISFPEGYIVDPNQDPNPATQINIINTH